MNASRRVRTVSVSVRALHAVLASRSVCSSMRSVFLHTAAVGTPGLRRGASSTFGELKRGDEMFGSRRAVDSVLLQAPDLMNDPPKKPWSAFNVLHCLRSARDVPFSQRESRFQGSSLNYYGEGDRAKSAAHRERIRGAVSGFSGVRGGSRVRFGHTKGFVHPRPQRTN
jgi:hypothetical protein